MDRIYKRRTTSNTPEYLTDITGIGLYTITEVSSISKKLNEESDDVALSVTFTGRENWNFDISALSNKKVTLKYGNETLQANTIKMLSNGALCAEFTVYSSVAKLNSVLVPELHIDKFDLSNQDILNFLPKTVTIVTDSKRFNTTSVLWGELTGYDENATVQTLTIDGTVLLPDYIDRNGQSINLTTTIYCSNLVYAPAASLENGIYDSAQTVELSSQTMGAVIYYTTDGSVPDENSAKYTSPIAVFAQNKGVTATIKTVAIKDGLASDCVTYEYTSNDCYIPKGRAFLRA